MNHVIRAIAETAEGGALMGGVTVFFVAFFLAWIWSAYAPANRARWEQAARIPFDDGDDQ